MKCEFENLEQHNAMSRDKVLFVAQTSCSLVTCIQLSHGMAGLVVTDNTGNTMEKTMHSPGEASYLVNRMTEEQVDDFHFLTLIGFK